jgi:molybdate transport system regulatory protein
MKKELRVRCWIDIDGERFFGPGRADLLELIAKSGSISKAAKTMGMSYKKAWDMVNEMNSRGKKTYVISHKGGDKGGGAEVTADGKKILANYKQLDKQLRAIVVKHKGILKLV